MLSRINQIPRYNAIIRQISTNLILSKQYQVKTEPSSERDKGAAFRTDLKKQFKNFDSQSMKKNDFKIKNLYEKKSEEQKTEPIDAKESLKKIIDQLSQNKNSFQNLIQPCQQMNELFEQDQVLTESFLSDPLKNPIINQLVLNLDKMSIGDFFTASQFILRFDPNKYDRVQPFLNSQMNNMTLDQLIKTLFLLRTPQLYKMQLLDTVRSLTNSIRNRLEEIENYAQLKLATKIFYAEPTTTKRLDQKLLKLAEHLKASDWVDLLNSRSIYRLRDMAILDLCSYNLIKLKKIDLDSIQKCLLSCGILSYHDQQFYKFLLESLHDQLKRNDSKDWLKKNEKNLLSILSSIGMLQLRDDKLLDMFQYKLEKDSDVSKLIVTFVTSCGNLNYKVKNLNKLKSKIDLKSFDLTDRKEKVSLLNYVWSLCSLDSPDSKLIDHVLGEQFWQDLLVDKPEEKKIAKVVLLKILNINLYSILCMDSYQGTNLPEDFSISNYPELMDKKPYQNDSFVSTLSSFRSIDKYYKLNMLTPFGIFIDALMVVDKNGVPCQLENFLKENLSLETSDDEFKVAFKLIGPRDTTLMNQKLNGVVRFQLKMLKELGYHTILINQEELKTANLIDRVNIIQNKLKDIVKK
ncbi:TBRG4 isoform X1 [Brachionus plicatilis]|uniref:TBRG4 isoform X1 n=1 Tax=Brachionus plicatilis TaxID=10195 RepID=A0A3M7SMI4_BRAPC|nr:TBRG4 isoform X1 [Brachionus plicatilis]